MYECAGVAINPSFSIIMFFAPTANNIFAALYVASLHKNLPSPPSTTVLIDLFL